MRPAYCPCVRTVEIDTLEDFDRHVAAGEPGVRMRGWQMQDLDLSGRVDVLRVLDPAGALFLGCRMPADVEGDLRRRGALVFPSVPHVPFDPWRSSLYTPEELYDGLDADPESYHHTPDARIYAWSKSANLPRRGGTSLSDTLAMSVHDNSIDDALAEFVDGRRTVGVMGGHAIERGQPEYADAALLGLRLAESGLMIATGGGPGAMEAANLGAALAGADHAERRLEEALAKVATVPTFRPSVTEWARVAFEAVPERSELSLGVPTWFYGHEPPNPFCTRIAKYFHNSIREDVLLHVARAGIVFLPGAAGTVQEIFQAACENYYAAAADVAPMILVGRDQWQRDLPAWPLLEVLGVGRPFGARAHLLDRPDEVPAALGQEL